MNKRKALGRGLSTLIPTHSDEDDRSGEIQQVDINAIDTNPYQPRIDFDEDEITGLAESIKNQGLLQPVVLRKNGDRYEIISGERRFRAFRHLKRDTVPCIVKTNVADKEMLELALVENIQREQLNEIEKALAYKKLIEEFDYTHDALAQQVGMSRTVITNCLRLLNLPEEVQQMVRTSAISSGHARALLSLGSESEQISAAQKIVADKLTVRDIEQFGIQKKVVIDPVEVIEDVPDSASAPIDLDTLPRQKVKPPVQEAPLDADTLAAIEKLQYKFGTPVKIKMTGDCKGRVEINYFSKDDLLRVFDLLLREE